jgi:hypothetical protein
MKTLVVLLTFGILIVGCASVPITPIAKDNEVGVIKDVKVAEKVVAVDNSETVKTETKQSAGRDFQQVNDSEMIKDLFARYTGMVEKLIASNDRTIYILIIQLCALLTMFIRKDEKTTASLIKFISEDEEREDSKK